MQSGGFDEAWPLLKPSAEARTANAAEARTTPRMQQDEGCSPMTQAGENVEGGRVPSSCADLSTDTPRVAVLMRSKNEQPHVEQALIGLRRQTYRNYVLYNVDSGSDDGTFEVVQRFNPVAERVARIPPETYVPAKVLNFMIENAHESIIVLLNADAAPVNEHWLENLLGPILNGKADATLSRQVARASAPFVVKRDLAHAYSAKLLQRKPTDFYSAVACAFRRSLWEETKFFTDGYSEDLAWSKACREKGARFQFVPDSVVEHSHDFTLEGFYQRRYREGLAFIDIYGGKPDPARQFASCVKGMACDLIAALVQFQPHTIPYNIAYRAVLHWGYYRGKCEGQRRYGRGM